MRSPLVTDFHETLGSCFASTLKDMLGYAVCESVYGLLERNGIPRGEICNRFDDTVAVLTKILVHLRGCSFTEPLLRCFVSTRNGPTFPTKIL